MNLFTSPEQLEPVVAEASASTNAVDLKMISIFSGGGGLDLGLEAAGFTTVFASDVDEHSCNTLQRGKEASLRAGRKFLVDAIVERADIAKLKGRYVLDKIGMKPGEVDLLAGGPPCQAYSVFGRRKGLGDPRGQLSFEYLRFLTEIKPKAFIFENVYGLLTIDGGKVFQELCGHLSRPGKRLRYTLSVFRLNAHDYGVPQHRDRVFIVGSQDGTLIDNVPPITDGAAGTMLRKRTVSDAFRGLPQMGAGGLANHTGRKHSQRIIDRYSGMVFGERDRHTRINKLDPTKPSFTIIVGSDAGGGKGHIHPQEPREVTPRESARIQTFPDWWEFSGKGRHPIRQVGNAVPPLMAAAVGNELRAAIFRAPKIDFKDIVKSLGQEHLFPEF